MIVFDTFKRAVAFVKENQGGVITRNQNGIGFVVEHKKSICDKDAASDRHFIASWSDLHTGLTWGLTLDGFSKTSDRAQETISKMNRTNFLGCSDWRLPLSRELEYLKSLESTEKAELRNLYIVPKFSKRVRPEFPERISWRYWSKESIDSDDYHDSKIKWVGGEYAGFENSNNNQKTTDVIGVRGNVRSSFDWVVSLSKWATDNYKSIRAFPLSEKDILDLEELTVDVGPIPIEVRNLVNLKRLKLKTLDCSESFIFTMNSLEEISVSGYDRLESFEKYNPLKAVPLSLGNMVNLRTLDLSSSRIKSLPDSIGNLVNLRTLDLSKTPDLSTSFIKRLPDSIGNLVNLMILNLSSSKIKSLPGSIGRLVNLRTLDLSSSKIQRLPDSIGRLVNLKSLNLAFTDVYELPDSIFLLHDLEVIKCCPLESSWSDLHTGLTWGRPKLEDGSEIWKRENAEHIIYKMNCMNFLGCNDWRLPTLKELKSLASEEKEGSLRQYIRPEFVELISIFGLCSYWSNDSRSKGFVWNYRTNSALEQNSNNKAEVLGVRE